MILGFLATCFFFLFVANCLTMYWQTKYDDDDDDVGWVTGRASGLPQQFPKVYFSEPA